MNTTGTVILMLMTLGLTPCARASEPVDVIEPTKAHLPADFYSGWTTPLIRLDSPEGRALLRSDSPDYAPLLAKWEPQLKSHCGACSSVITMNSLLPGAGFTQNSIFNPSTAHIIAQETVYRIGFTLEELTSMIRVSSGLRTERFHAGEGDGEHGLETFLATLRAGRDNPDNRVICNFAVGWLRERKNKEGHFSIVADYDGQSGQVLILEVSGVRPSFWIDARELWGAMNQVDKVSGRVRGWIVVSRADG